MIRTPFEDSGRATQDQTETLPRLWVGFAAAKVPLERLLFAIEVWETEGRGRHGEQLQDFLQRYDHILDVTLLMWAEASLPHKGADDAEHDGAQKP